jgi:hypothetical protein
VFALLDLLQYIVGQRLQFEADLAHPLRHGAAWADVIKVSIYCAAEMTRVKLCEAAHNGESSCFQLAVRRR